MNRHDIKEIHDDYIIDIDGVEHYYKDNYIYKRICKFKGIHYFNELGQYHRLDGPAVEWEDGRKDYYMNGKLHRLDGPALIFCRYESYYINGKQYTKFKYNLYKYFAKFRIYDK